MMGLRISLLITSITPSAPRITIPSLRVFLKRRRITAISGNAQPSPIVVMMLRITSPIPVRVEKTALKTERSKFKTLSRKALIDFHRSFLIFLYLCG